MEMIYASCILSGHAQNLLHEGCITWQNYRTVSWNPKVFFCNLKELSEDFILEVSNRNHESLFVSRVNHKVSLFHPGRCGARFFVASCGGFWQTDPPPALNNELLPLPYHPNKGVLVKLEILEGRDMGKTSHGTMWRMNEEGCLAGLCLVYSIKHLRMAPAPPLCIKDNTYSMSKALQGKVIGPSLSEPKCSSAASSSSTKISF
ncbi:hypothetical protein AKJ16_DCAP00979 [Drosera capensis]